MQEPIEVTHIYKDNFNTKAIEFEDGQGFKVGELALHKKVTRLNDDGTQTETYHFAKTSYIH